ncbi:MAG: IclR family transcriptional regulator [Nitratireductor sp.]|nr:IclR family transcriptional regulator [Nitratireductor sp.]
MTSSDNDIGLKSVHLTIDALELLSREQRDIGISEMANLLGTTKGTVFRHMQTLLARGYVTQSESSHRYRLGPQAACLGQSAIDHTDIVERARPHLSALREATGETVALSLVDQQGVVILSKVMGKSPLEIGVRVGSRLALHSSAQGKIALAFGPSLLLAQYERQDLASFTPHTIETTSELKAALERIRQTGIAEAPNEYMLGVNAIAAPIRDRSGALVATVAVVGSIQNVDARTKPEMIEAIVATAQKISTDLGYVGNV